MIVDRPHCADLGTAAVLHGQADQGAEEDKLFHDFNFGLIQSSVLTPFVIPPRSAKTPKKC